jgi:hypothetical protein
MKDLLRGLYVYDPTNMTWTNLSTPASGKEPSRRMGHGFSSSEGKLYVHGGQDAKCKKVGGRAQNTGLKSITNVRVFSLSEGFEMEFTT